MARVDARFNFLKEFREDPPFWFYQVVMFCCFEYSQRHQLLGGRVFRPDSKSFSSSQIERAIECGLLEPIFYSIAQYDGDFEELLDTLKSTAPAKSSDFPWIFLAYLGTRNKRIELVKRCITIVREKNKVPETHEFGMSYWVWRFLLKHGDVYTAEGNALLELALQSGHDWTFVHLAAAHGHSKCLRILLARPENQNYEVLSAATEVEGFTPLHLAAYYGRTSIVRLLLEHAERTFRSAADAGSEPQAQNDITSADDAGSEVIGNSLPSAAGAGPEVQGEVGLGSNRPAAAGATLNTCQQEVEDWNIARSIPKDRFFKRSPLHYASLLSCPEVVSLLIDKWKHVGVDLPDCFGITSLHCAVPWTYRGDQSNSSVQVWNQLLKVSKKPNLKVQNDIAVQQAAIHRLLLDKRRYVNAAASSKLLMIPSPTITEGFFWSSSGFTALHCAAVHASACHFDGFVHCKGVANPGWLEKDCHKLNPLEYAAFKNEFNNFLKKHMRKGGMITRRHQQQMRFVSLRRVERILLEADQTNNQFDRLKWAYAMSIHLLSGRYGDALQFVENIEKYAVPLVARTPAPKLKVDDEVWDHLEWALDKALWPASGKTTSIMIGGPRLHPSEAEEMVLRLVQKNVLHGQSAKQRCLQWAIGKTMARLAEELVKDKECELFSIVPGAGRYKESPLARASKSSIAAEMPGLLTAMELREDVARRWFEDRQVYVGYVNTLMVVAVLIAELGAFAAWLQPPRGFDQETGFMDMQPTAMKVFVYSSSLAFFLGMGTMVAAATGAVPFTIGAGQLVSGRGKVSRSVVVASLLLMASVACLAISFSVGLLAILARP